MHPTASVRLLPFAHPAGIGMAVRPAPPPPRPCPPAASAPDLPSAWRGVVLAMPGVFPATAESLLHATLLGARSCLLRLWGPCIVSHC